MTVTNLLLSGFIIACFALLICFVFWMLDRFNIGVLVKEIEALRLQECRLQCEIEHLRENRNTETQRFRIGGTIDLTRDEPQKVT